MNLKEIEKKYTVKYLPKNMKVEKIQEIEQIYLYKDKNTTIRIRKINECNCNKYIYTVKTKGDIEQNTELMANRYEIESEISKKYFEELENKKINNKIIKRRVVVPIKNNLKVEIDVYHERLKGFLTAEVEFPTEEDARNFNKPDWLGKQLDSKKFSNGRLAKMTDEELTIKLKEIENKESKEIIKTLNNL